MTIELLTSAVTFIVTIVIVAIAMKLARQLNILDYPNQRSSHAYPTPRIGGIGIVSGAVTGIVGFLFLSNSSQSLNFTLLISMLVLAAIIGFADDIINLPILVRMPAYILVSAAIARTTAVVDFINVPGLPQLSLGVVGGLIFSTLFIAWYANLFNFMDGIDGIAGSTGMVTLGVFSLAFFFHDNVMFGILALNIAVSTAGFLFFNYPPARIFMGDSGSIFLGMTIGSVALISISQSILSMPAAFLIILPFAFDTTITLLHRIIFLKSFWKAHHNHLYQKMCELGYGHRVVATIYALAAIMFGSIGLLFDKMPEHAGIFTWWFSLLFLTAFSVIVFLKKQAMSKEVLLPEARQVDT